MQTDDLERSLPESTVPTRAEFLAARAAGRPRVLWHALRSVSGAHTAVRELVDP